MSYVARSFDAIKELPGFGAQLMTNHFSLYQGYVKNVNSLSEKIEAIIASGTTGTPEFNELSRRFGWEFNGMRLHELFFENMTTSDVGAPLERLSAFIPGFKALGSVRGIGWAVMYLDPSSDRIFNVWVNEHDVGHLSGCIPLLVMDLFEHAYMTDYGIKRADYVEAFMHVINWNVVNARLGKNS